MKYLNLLIKFTKEIFKIIIFIISILFSVYFILGTVYSTLFIELQFKEKIISSMLDREMIIILSAILVVSEVLGFKKAFKPILTKGEIVIYLFSSYFLSYFIVRNFQFSGKLFVIAILIMSASFFFLLLRLTDFFINFSILYLKGIILKEIIRLSKNIDNFIYYFNNIFFRSVKATIEIIQGRKKNIFNKKVIVRIIYNSLRLIISIIFSLIIFLSIIILTIGLSGWITFKINQYFDYKNKQRKSFIITKIVPKNTIKSEEVVLKGYHFGWNLNRQYKLISKEGQINDIKLWTDNEIKFTVPLHLKEGKNLIWLEKPESESSDSTILKSNKVSLNIISVWEFYPTQINFENLLYPIQGENFLKRIKKFIFFNLKLGDLINFL